MNKTLIVLLMCVCAFIIGYYVYELIIVTPYLDCSLKGTTPYQEQFFNQLNWNCSDGWLITTTDRNTMIESLNRNCTLMRVE